MNMGLWSRFLGRKAAEPNSQSRFWLDLLDTYKTVAGIRVTPHSAMKTSAVWAAINVRCEDTGKVPCHLYRRLNDGSKERATDHKLYTLITTRPNERQTAFEFKSMLQMQLDLYGNALAVKDLSRRGEVSALWPVPWPRVTVLVTDDEKDVFYRVTMKSGEQVTYPAEAVLHIRGKTFDGIIGVSPIAYHAETIGLAVATDRHAAALYGNAARPSGALKIKQVIGKEAKDLLRADWEARFNGPESNGKMVVLDGEMDWLPFSMTQEDAQYIETRAASNQDIYRIFRVPPHKVGDLSKATFSNIEQQAIEYVTDCLMAIFVNWEQALSRDLLTEDERGQYFFEFLSDALLRGDLKSRYDAYAIARNWGVLSVNDIRDRENLNRIPNGNIYLQPLNMIEAGKEPPPATAGMTSKGSAKALLALAKTLVAREEADEQA